VEAADDMKLRERLTRPEILVVPASFDMLSAKLIERAGFEAVYLSGYGHCASHLGMPDAGLMSFAEVAERVRNLVRCVGIPVLADGDTGYGNVVNVKRTVEEFEAAGAQAIQLEDQEFPKRCGHVPGKSVVPAEEMVRKLQAAQAARRSDEFLVIARTDALQVVGIDEALRRARLYEQAGADVLFVESPTTVDEMERIGGSFETPLMINQIEGGRTPLLPVRELERLGFDLVAYALTALMAAVRGMAIALGRLRDEGTPVGLQGENATFDEIDALVGFPEVRDWERRFALEAGPRRGSA
jgi:2-methylisocitrate lyase-like PEP mutase family enzyme